MYSLRTDPFGRRSRGPAGRGDAERGSALLTSLVVFVGLLGLVYASVTMSSVEVRDSRRTIDDVRTRHLAQAGVEQGLHYLTNIVEKTKSYDPLNSLATQFAAGAITPFVGQPVMDGGSQVGSFTTSMSLVAQTQDNVIIEVTSTGYLPEAPVNLGPNQQVKSWHSVTARVQYTREPSSVFDHAYFINNWGWFYGSTIECNGNARSNGQFDSGGYAPLVTGQPIYDDVAFDGVNASLVGYQDDNGDGLFDGNDGGIYSGWDIVGVQNVRGNGGKASNQHDFLDPIEMPNLSDLTQYETNAVAEAGTISIGGTTMTNAVYGDEPGELQNLYLEGTLADPIVLNGPVVVRGDVIISGVVTGQGAIYAGGNVYVPDSIKYLDGPTTKRPASNAQADTEAWLSANWNKDFLGLFARENVVVGDHSHWLWQHYVGGWMGSSLNSSKEDAGEDNIPNTRKGKDGVLGTADDDVLEGDGVFTVEYYSAADLAMGAIPPGYNVGDVIPGSGEDIDGDGVYDGTTTLADVTLTTPMDTANFGGNMPAAGIAAYSDIATLYADVLDATMYTNHSFCYVTLGSSDASVNGSIVSRNENIVYGTPTIEMNHDVRLLGGSNSVAGGLLPWTISKPVVLRWTQLEQDPNRGAGIAP